MSTSSGKKKIAVAGAAGMLGGYLLRELVRLPVEVLPFDIRELDITKAAETEKYLLAIRPDLLINAAAYTNVNGCETDKAAAFAVNAEGVRNLAQACKNIEAEMIHVSTDYVFDGTKSGPYVEEDKANPLSVYGASKLVGEEYLRATLEKYFIVRTAWLYGRGGVNFVDKMIDLARARDSLTVVNDQIGSPTYAKDLAQAIVKLIGTRAYGTYHFTGAGSTTWYDLAQACLRLTGQDQDKIAPCTTEQFPQPARRPAKSVLANVRGAALGITLRPWLAALEDYLANDKARP